MRLLQTTFAKQASLTASHGVLLIHRRLSNGAGRFAEDPAANRPGTSSFQRRVGRASESPSAKAKLAISSRADQRRARSQRRASWAFLPAFLGIDPLINWN